MGGEHFQLRARLPWYRTSSHGPHNDQSLKVQVIGQSLVLQGQSTSDHMVRSFQRTFQLPEATDIDSLRAAYSLADGMFLMDFVATSESAPVALHTSTNILDDELHGKDLRFFGMDSSGSHTTITLPCSGMSSSIGLDLLDHSLDDLRGFLWDTPNANLKSSDSQKPLGSPPKQRNKQSSSQQRPLLLQPKDAKPFWRLVDDKGEDNDEASKGAALEVVAPRGVRLGLPVDTRIPTYNDTDAALRGSSTPNGEIKLPISVSGEDCAWNAGQPPHSKWLVVGLLASVTASTGVWLVLLTWGCKCTRDASLSTRKTPLWSKILRGLLLVLFLALLLGLAISVSLSYRLGSELEERVLRCRIGRESIKKLVVHITNEL